MTASFEEDARTEEGDGEVKPLVVAPMTRMVDDDDDSGAASVDEWCCCDMVVALTCACVEWNSRAYLSCGPDVDPTDLYTSAGGSGCFPSRSWDGRPW